MISKIVATLNFKEYIMKNLLFFIIVYVLIFMSCKEKTDTVILTGSVDKISSGTAMLINISNPSDRAEVLDSAEIIDHNFQLDLNIKEGILPVSLSLKNKEGTKSSSGLFLASNSNTECEVINGQFKFSGNEVQDTFTAITNSFMKKVQLFQKYASSDPDSFKIISNELYQLTSDLLERHGESQYSLFAYSIATNYLMMKFGDSYYSKFAKYCNEDIDIQQNVWKFNFCKQIEMMTAQASGTNLNPEFTLRDKDEKLVSLSDFEGKALLLDFWAYWCGPCIKDIPKLKSIYKNNKQNGFEIVSISTDLRKQPWIKAVEKHNTPWVQVMDSKIQTESLTLKLNVGPIPRYILLNANHEIVNLDVDSNDLESEILKVLGN
jgi:thiol-disulfide isomerase/thioredoxin